MGIVGTFGKEKSLRDNHIQDIRNMYYWHVHRMNHGKNEPRWRGVQVVKYPNDLILYAEAFFENKPDYVIEVGTRFGGSALFFGDMLELCGGKGQVLTIDVEPQWSKAHPRAEYIHGSSIDPEIVKSIREKVSGNVMVVLDGNHTRRHVIQEIRLYNNIVTPGQFLVVEDCYTKYANPYGPGQAVEWFLKRTKNYVLENPESRFLLAVTRGGWLRRTA